MKGHYYTPILRHHVQKMKLEAVIDRVALVQVFEIKTEVS